MLYQLIHTAGSVRYNPNVFDRIKTMIRPYLPGNIIVIYKQNWMNIMYIHCSCNYNIYLGWTVKRVY